MKTTSILKFQPSRLLLASLAALLFSCTFAAAEEYTADHNGSRMIISEENGYVEITYDQPKRSLRRNGVRSGTVLFTGTIDDRGRLDGDARVFRAGCEPEKYNVRGDYDRYSGSFVLHGAAPVRVSGGCEVIRYTENGSNAELLFTYDDRDASGPGAGEEGGVEGEGYCGWWAVYACHRSRSATRSDQRQAGYGRIVRTSEVPNFRSGYFCLADGPLQSKSTAQDLIDQVIEDFPDGYVKQGC